MFTREAIASFNELECSLYGYISKNAKKVAYMKIRELTDETHVSTSTILRFCRKVDWLVTRNLKSDIIVKKMLDEMLEAHKEDLPQFFNEVKS